MKKILFLTGTRADFGKLKSLIHKVEACGTIDTHIFVTGMHMLSKYGLTANEVDREGFKNVYRYINQSEGDSMDCVLAKTIHGLSDYVKEVSPDLIVVHGDRVEAMAGAIVGSLNSILVAHIEGGEVSGTIDELIRHAITKMAHMHFVCNDQAANRLLQLGEIEQSVYVIGSPDLDIMQSRELPTLEEAKQRYGIDFSEYAIFMFHPVTTELDEMKKYFPSVIRALNKSGKKYIVIYPNNDHGSEIIFRGIEDLSDDNVRVFPSLRFEHFLTFLKYAQFIIGNSSAGVREAPFYGVPSVNIGSRQNGRATAPTILNVSESEEEIFRAIEEAPFVEKIETREFGDGNSADLFIEAVLDDRFWRTSGQKIFVDRVAK